MKGSRQIAAPRAVVWAALNDAEVLKTAIPGCQSLSGSPGEGFTAVVKQKVGPVSATFEGQVRLTDIVAMESYTIVGEGKGGAAGFAKGQAAVTLADGEGGGTILTYDVKAQRRRQDRAARLAPDRRLRQEDRRQLLRQLPGCRRAIRRGAGERGRRRGADRGRREEGRLVPAGVRQGRGGLNLPRAHDRPARTFPLQSGLVRAYIPFRPLAGTMVINARVISGSDPGAVPGGSTRHPRWGRTGPKQDRRTCKGDRFHSAGCHRYRLKAYSCQRQLRSGSRCRVSGN